MTTRGFSLVEVLVATSIFALVSVAMLGIYGTATELVRQGESRRASADEAVATLALLEDDLRRIVPPQIGGFFLTQYPNPADLGWDMGGSMALAFTLADHGRVVTRTTRDRPLRLVLWMTDQQHRLWRIDGPAPSEPVFPTIQAWFTAIANRGATDPVDFAAGDVTFQPVALGCVLFSLDLPRPGSTSFVPAGSTPWCSESIGGDPPAPFPDQLRLTLAFTKVGSQEGRGRLIPVTAETFRVSGLRPPGPGGWLRIASGTTVEWIEIEKTVAGEMHRLPAANSHKWRTVERDLLTQRNAEVLAPVFYSVTRSVGR